MRVAWWESRSGRRKATFFDRRVVSYRSANLRGKSPFSLRSYDAFPNKESRWTHSRASEAFNI
eukprot:scaffold12474_cov119-Skeletonema_marinoi.AAC.1